MLAIPDETKLLYQADSISKTLIVNFYPVGTYKIHPRSTLYPASTLYLNSKGTPLLTISEKQIMSETVVITEGLFTGDTLNFRSCYSSKCSLTGLNLEMDVYGYDMEVIQEIGGVKVPLFTGTVDEAKQRDDKVSLVAYDYLYYNYGEDMTVWYNGLSFPMTIKEFRLALYDVCNIPFEEIDLVNDERVLEKAKLSGTVTGRDFLAMIGELNGAFVHVKNWTAAYNAKHSHSNKSVLDNTTASYTTAEQTKLSNIEAGAQKNTVTGIKGNAETSYRSGNVNLTPANIGAAPSSHGTHVSFSTAAPVMDGTASAGSAPTVARSDHKHPVDTSRAPASHTHAASQVSAGTLAGKVQANAAAMATLSGAQVRDIVVKDTVTEGGTATEPNGTIVFSKS